MSSELAPSLLDTLDAWENCWFPIADAYLRARFPSEHEWERGFRPQWGSANTTLGVTGSTAYACASVHGP